MSTTSLKLPDDLKARVQSLAENEGFSSHAFMVNAVEQAVQQAEAQRAFIAAAEASLDDVRNGAAVYAAEDVHRWIKARLAARGAGRTVPEPAPIRGRDTKKASKAARA